MPYTCSAHAGRVELAPSREESYRIYGQREERPYTVCSPINPNACRTWLLHRFDLDCGGTRVGWISVVEAASEQSTRRAWVEDGRLRMRMNQYWSRDLGPDDDPCPRWRRRGPYGQDCADGGFQRRGPVVEMPAGFAPAFGLPIRFVGSDVPPMPADPRFSAEAPSRSGPAWTARVEPPRDMPARDMPYRDMASRDMASRDMGSRDMTARDMTSRDMTSRDMTSRDMTSRDMAARDMPVREPVGKEPLAKDPPAKVPQVAGSSSTTSASGTAKAPVRPVAPAETAVESSALEQAKPKPPEPAREAAPADPTKTSGVGTGSIVPKIINRPATEQASPGNGMVSKPTTPYVEKVPEPVAVRVTEAKPASEPSATPKPIVTSSAKPNTVSEPGPGTSMFNALAPSATTQALVGFAGLVAVALGLFAWTRHREQLSLAAAGGREFGSVSFDTGDAKPSVWSRGPALGRPQAARPTPPHKPEPPKAVASADVQVPRTREEACKVLGANPDAGEAAIRKIVEGLRQSWHPDLATSEADRQMREQRTTQINVAWDILSGKRRPA